MPCPSPMRSTIQTHPRSDTESFERMRRKVLLLWAGIEGYAYDKVGAEIFQQWTHQKPYGKDFLEEAVDLLVEFQNRPMRNMKDCLEWSNYLKKASFQSKKYFAWIQEQYELLASEERKGFEDITLKKFCDCLVKGNWMTANDESAIVNAYLLHTETSLKPEIYLGTLEDSHIAVRVNGECITPQKADLLTAQSYGVTAINPDVLLEMRYLPLGSDRRNEVLFIPIGNVFSMPLSPDKLDRQSFQEGDWQETGVVLVAQLALGLPSLLYMVQDLELCGDDRKPLGAGLIAQPFTLARVLLYPWDLTPYDSLSKRQSFQISITCDSKLDIVQTGERGKWHEGYPPVGLYPIDQNSGAPP